MTMFSFLEVLESTCSSLGSKAKHRRVKASGNDLTQHQTQLGKLTAAAVV